MGGDVFSTVTDAARSLHLQDDEAAVLGDIVRQAHRCLPEFDHVSLSLVRDRDRLETLSATGTLALAFDQLQSESGDGPCADAIAEGEVVAVRHARGAKAVGPATSPRPWSWGCVPSSECGCRTTGRTL